MALQKKKKISLRLYAVQYTNDANVEHPVCKLLVGALQLMFQ